PFRSSGAALFCSAAPPSPNPQISRAKISSIHADSPLNKPDMFSDTLASHLRTTLSEIEAAGLYKRERLIDSTQNATVRLKDGREVINMCANNYLGLA